MSDTAIAILVVPFLVGITLVLEGARIGCTWFCRRCREPRLGSTGERVGHRQEPASR